ncbi:MAG: S-ribosylhomocysteine lyase [Clostridia bacterium]|nr:S-ribosylhomocysteine lyase [Clostridia bacterium]
MEKIASFKIDHERLMRGVFVSRIDGVGGEKVTTFDIRMKMPNREPVMNTAEIHTIEHLGATFLRNLSEIKDKVIYFGPMGCRTGFYLIVSGELTSKDILPVISETFLFISQYDGEVPGADPVSCGNYLDMNLRMAVYEADKFYKEVLLCAKRENLEYPD